MDRNAHNRSHKSRPRVVATHGFCMFLTTSRFTAVGESRVGESCVVARLCTREESKAVRERREYSYMQATAPGALQGLQK